MMRKTTVVFLLLTITLNLSAEDVSKLLYSFSPLAQIYLKHLGLQDKNNNGVIDKDSGEGYEEFITKYGNADTGFYVNGVLYGASNGKLEEPEIIDHYYMHIRFNPNFEEETSAIENAVKAYIYANDLPLIWLDDEQGTVMNAVNNILGEGWNEKEVTEEEAVQLFNRVIGRLNIKGRTGTPSRNGGYYTLPELVTKKAGYCFEVAQFGFWFFSELKVNSVSARAYLTSTVIHEVLKLKSDKIVDYFMSGRNIANNRWQIVNPLRDLAKFYEVVSTIENDSIPLLENTVLYDKYNLVNIDILMYYVDNKKVIVLGEFLLDNIEINTIAKSTHLNAAKVRENLKNALILLGIAYYETNDRTKLQKVVELLTQYYKSDKNIKYYLDRFK